VFVPAGSEAARAAALRAAGYATVAGLDPAADPQAEAARLTCGFFLTAAGLAALAAE
jgi:ATP phosphoribosyltransferase regulatory subunit